MWIAEGRLRQGLRSLLHHEARGIGTWLIDLSNHHRVSRREAQRASEQALRRYVYLHATETTGDAMIDTSATVFVVDDEKRMRQSLRWLINSVNLRVATFPSARAFLTAYRPS